MGQRITTKVTALPARGEVFCDQRGTERALRVSWHSEVGLVVLSLWREDRCVGTFRLEAEEVPALVNALVTGLATAASAAATDGPPRRRNREGSIGSSRPIFADDEQPGRTLYGT